MDKAGKGRKEGAVRNVPTSLPSRDEVLLSNAESALGPRILGERKKLSRGE